MKLMQICAEAYNVEAKDLVAKTRKSDIVNARYLYFFLMKKYKQAHEKKLAQTFKLDRTTVFHGISKINETLELYEKFKINETEYKRIEKAEYRFLNHGRVLIYNYKTKQVSLNFNLLRIR